MEPGAIYTFTTTTGQHRGQTAVPPHADFPLPYADDFESYEPGRYAKYFSDQAGVFEVALRSDGRGKCLRQVVDKKGIEWQPMREPCTILGSKTWQNYTVSVDARIEGRGHAVAFRPGIGDYPECGAASRLPFDDRLTMATGPSADSKTVLAKGRAPLDPKAWHTLKLTLVGPQITASLDGTELGTAVDAVCPSRAWRAIGSGWNCMSLTTSLFGPSRGNLAPDKKAWASLERCIAQSRSAGKRRRQE